MRLLGALYTTLRWRVAVARSGLAMRVTWLLTMMFTLGGIGIAIGYAVVGRGRVAEDDSDPAEKDLAP